jgi:hypothetical protein
MALNLGLPLSGSSSHFLQRIATLSVSFAPLLIEQSEV